MAFDIKQAIIDQAKKQGIDPDFALSVMDVESAGNPDATSKTGAKGLYQMFPDAVKDVGGDYNAMLNNPALQVEYGVKYLKQKYDQAGGDYAKTLGYFNQGKAGFDKQLKTGEFAPEVVGYLKKPQFSDFVADSQLTNIANPMKGLNDQQTQNNKFSSGALMRSNIPDLPTQAESTESNANPSQQVDQQTNLTTAINTTEELAKERKRYRDLIEQQKAEDRNKAYQTAAAGAMAIIFGHNKNNVLNVTGDDAGKSYRNADWGSTTQDVLGRLNRSFSPSAINTNAYQQG